MPTKLAHEDLIAAIALNSKLTAWEIEEALEVLSVVVQQTLQEKGEVDLLGVGTFSTSGDSVVFTPGSSLSEAAADPTIQIKIERRTGVSPEGTYQLQGIAAAKHKVNVC